MQAAYQLQDEAGAWSEPAICADYREACGLAIAHVGAAGVIAYAVLERPREDRPWQVVNRARKKFNWIA